MELNNLILIYYGILNFFGLILMIIDKKRAEINKWRISEKNLLIIGLLGGAFGAYIGMKGFRHKTKHKAFSIGIPFFMIIHLILMIYLFNIM